jgi:hypothetical protein
MKANQPDEYDKAKFFAKELFSDIQEPKFLVSSKQQDEELKKLKIGLRDEQFYIIVDMLSFEIVAAGGLEEVGFRSDDFSMRQYFKLLETDGVVQAMTLLAREMFRLTGKAGMKFMSPKYISQLPLKNQSGQTILVKRVMSPWQVLADGRACSYISEFTIVSPLYQGETLNPRFIGLEEPILTELNKQIAIAFSLKSHFKNPFSPKEMLILTQYSKLRQDESLNSIAEATGINIKVSTLKFYNKMILEKARKMFGELGFRTARDVANYLKKHGLIQE